LPDSLAQPIGKIGFSLTTDQTQGNHLLPTSCTVRKEEKRNHQGGIGSVRINIVHELGRTIGVDQLAEIRPSSSMFPYNMYPSHRDYLSFYIYNMKFA
jgi:hypothetical protein